MTLLSPFLLSLLGKVSILNVTLPLLFLVHFCSVVVRWCLLPSKTFRFRTPRHFRKRLLPWSDSEVPSEESTKFRRRLGRSPHRFVFTSNTQASHHGPWEFLMLFLVTRTSGLLLHLPLYSTPTSSPVPGRVHLGTSGVTPSKVGLLNFRPRWTTLNEKFYSDTDETSLSGPSHLHSLGQVHPVMSSLHCPTLVLPSTYLASLYAPFYPSRNTTLYLSFDSHVRQPSTVRTENVYKCKVTHRPPPVTPFFTT